MKPPQAPGTSIDYKRKKRWHGHFLHYRYAPTVADIEEWVDQFDVAHRDVGARILDSVEVISRQQIDQAFRQLLAVLPGWNKNPKRRKGRWRFVPYSISAGESGDVMVACLRQAMGLRGRDYNELFVQPPDLVRQQLKDEDTLVLVDDFAGTGDQASTSWDSFFRELAAEVGTVYLMVVAASKRAQDEIVTRTDLQLIAHFNLDESDNVFSDKCIHFSSQDKATIESYGKKHFPQSPRGYGDCGLLFVLQHDCPSNSIPLLHGSRRDKWQPLFPRTSPK